jgi:hypothetical protein
MTSNTARRIRRRGGGKWLVLSRDISDSVRIDGEPQIWAGMVLDMETGQVRGVVAGTTESDAVAQALKTGLTKPAGSLPPGPPDEVLCAPGLKAQVMNFLSSLLAGDRLPPVRAVILQLRQRTSSTRSSRIC